MTDPGIATPTRSVVAGGIAALVPLLALGGALALLAVLFDGDLGRALQMAAPLGFAVIGAAAMASLGLAGLLFVAAWRGSAIPVALFVAVASTPWGMGALATLLSMIRVRTAVAFASPDMSGRLMMAGIEESLFGVVAGAWLSGALLAALGLGLAIGAVARRADAGLSWGDRLWPAALAVVVMLGASALPVVYREALHAWPLAYPALLTATVALALAAASIGRDRASGRLAAGAAFAALLGAIGSLLAVRAQSLMLGLAGAVHAAPETRSLFLSRGLSASVHGMDLVLFVGLAIGLVVALVAALAIARAPRRGPLVLGGVAALVGAFVVLGADRYVEATLRADALRATAEPWDRFEDFTPSHGSWLEATTAPHAIVTRAEVIPHAGAPVATTDAAALDALFARLRGVEDPRWPGDAAPDPELEDPPMWRGEDGPDEPSEEDVVVEHELALALDARLDRARLAAVLESVARAGVGAVSLMGATQPVSEHTDASARDPLWGRLLRGSARRELLLLEPALSPGAADRDPTLWRGTLDGAEALTLEARGGSSLRFPYGHVRHQDEGRLDGALVYLRLGEDVSPSRVLEAAHLVHMLGGRALLVLGAVPGHPEREASPADEAGVVERAQRGRLTVGALEDEAGAGLFDSAIVTRTIRARAGDIQRCYERLLATDPSLAGRVMIRFTIEPTGTVHGVVATENGTGRPDLAACVVGPIARLRFSPGPEGGSVTFTYPFVFEPLPPG